jgi:hypothetical protein
MRYSIKVKDFSINRACPQQNIMSLSTLPPLGMNRSL